MKEVLLKIWKFVKNKYVAATLIFLVFFCFLGEFNLMVSGRLHQEVRQLHEEEAALKESIKQDSIQANSLKGNKEAIERYGRENYYMKRVDEDIFVVETGKKR